jgi:hypothetical protein
MVLLCGCAKALDGGEWRDPATISQDVGGDGGLPPGDGDGDPVPITFCDAPTLVFQVADTQGGCNGSTCHAGIFPPDLILEGVAGRLRDAPAALCPQVKYIDSANIENSLILTKLTATPTCGAPMPFNLPSLADDKVQCLRDWVAGVAQSGQ